MARIFTDNDIIVMQQAVTQIENLIIEGSVGVENGAVIGNWFKHSPQTEVTTESVKQVVEQLRDQLKWKTTLQIEADRVAATMTEAQVQTVVNFIKTRGLLHDTTENLLTNFVVIAGKAQDKTAPFDLQGLDNILSRYLVNHVDGSRLRWKPRLQDSEKEAARVRLEQAAPTRTKDKAESLDPSIPQLAPHLRAHRDMLHREDKPAEVKPKDDSAEWKKLAEDVLQNTRSHVIQEKARKIMFANNGVPDWKQIYHARRRLIEQSGVR